MDKSITDRAKEHIDATIRLLRSILDAVQNLGTGTLEWNLGT